MRDASRYAEVMRIRNASIAVGSGAMRILMLLAVVLGACAGDSPDPTGKCTRSLYDVCRTEHDCEMNNCHNFMGDGFQVCTIGCNASNPCPPDPMGRAVECNNMGICKPAAPTECTPQ